MAALGSIICAWPPLLAGAIAVVWAELVGERSAAWIVLAFGMACLPFLDYSDVSVLAGPQSMTPPSDQMPSFGASFFGSFDPRNAM